MLKCLPQNVLPSFKNLVSFRIRGFAPWTPLGQSPKTPQNRCALFFRYGFAPLNKLHGSALDVCVRMILHHIRVYATQCKHSNISTREGMTAYRYSRRYLAYSG